MTLAQTSEDPDLKPSQVLSWMNETMWKAGKGKTTMTFFIGFFDFDRGELIYANAGHNPPFLIPSSLDDRRFNPNSLKIEAIPIRLAGTPLGALPDSTYKDCSMPIAAGDKFMFYTDGLIECTNSQLEMWGKRSMQKAFKGARESTIKEVQSRFINAAFQHFDNHPLADDVTVVVAGISQDWQPASETEAHQKAS
jgi:sigma-B regulation protein RsbU (phosphoserine phosphatase)